MPRATIARMTPKIKTTTMGAAAYTFAVEERPPTEYGSWARGEGGKVTRTVTEWYWSDLLGRWLFQVRVELHPDCE